MRFWIYGLDATSKAPRDPLFVEADDEATARAQARELGMQVEEVEPVLARPRLATPPPVPPPPKPAAPSRPAEPVTSREQLLRLGRVVRRVGEAYGFRVLVVGGLVATLVLAARINSRLDEMQSQIGATRSAVSNTQSEVKNIDSSVKEIDSRVEAIWRWMPRR